jgi:hypothetical protein
VCFTHVKALGQGALIPLEPSASCCTYNFRFQAPALKSGSGAAAAAPAAAGMFTRCCWRRKAADLHIRSICCIAGAAAVARRRRRRRRSLVTASRIAQDMPLLRGRPCILEYKQNKTLARSLSLSWPRLRQTPRPPSLKKTKEKK